MNWIQHLMAEVRFTLVLLLGGRLKNTQNDIFSLFKFTWKSIKASWMIQHWGNPIEPESVKAIDVNPHPQVGQKKPENLPIIVIEEPGIPQRMVASRTRMEKASICKVMYFLLMKNIVWWYISILNQGNTKII